MYTLMIIDDEVNVRTLLKNCIDWKELGIKIVAEAGSANEALDILEKIEPPDILFVDICMPMINGIDFIEKIRKTNMDSDILVISGMNDFYCVQKCMRLNVNDYISKPINEDYLYEKVVKICEKREKSQCNENLLNMLKNSEIHVKKKNKVIQEIIEYTQNHFCESSISLQVLSDKFSLNPAYICRAFKQETGENWNEYLTKLRIEKSIEILKSTDLKSYEIAEKVGYSDAKYFSLCFKTFTGQNFTKFRQNITFTK